MKENKGRIEVAKEVIKKTVPISELFKSYKRFDGAVWRGDGEWMINCPFHGDISPSLGIKEKEGWWNCFGCTAGGNAVNALIWLARTVDRTYYGYGEAIDVLIQRFPALREALPFRTVMDDSLVLSDVLARRQWKLSLAKESEVNMTTVYEFMTRNHKTSFMDIAYATTMMLNKQDPTQIIAFMGIGGDIVTKASPITAKVETNAADLLAGLDWEDE